MADRVDQRFGEYHLIRLLGRGSFSDVYLGEHLHDRTQAAVKVLQARLTNEDLREFINEASATFRLKHPHIVQLLDFGVSADDVLFLVMDYAPNGTLRQRYPKGTRLPLDTVASYVNQLASALQYAHDKRLIHRDVKPENILLGKNDKLLLSDFGIAVVTHSTRSLNTQGEGGTVPYMAPEQIQGKPRPASDQYALGIIVYEWLCGNRPFNGTATEIAMQHLHKSPPSLCEKVPTIPPDVEQVVMTALAKDSRQRFATVQDFAQALKLALEQEIQQKSSPLSSIISTIPQEQQAAAPASTENDRVVPLRVSLLARPADDSPSGAFPVQVNAGSHSAVSASIQADILPLPEALPKEQWNSGRIATTDAASTGSQIAAGRPRRLGQPLLIALVLILLTFLVFGGIIFASTSALGSLKSLVPGIAPSVTVTITPASNDVSNTYVIFGVTETPDPSQRQVQARQLSSASSTQSKTVNATGEGQTPGVQAKGTLTFSNGSTSAETVNAGTSFTGKDGVVIVNDVSAVIPGAHPPTEGSVTVAAHAANAGVSGNIKASDISGTCCFTSDFVTVQNTAPFTGGQDLQQSGPFVLQSNIDDAAKPLENTLMPEAQQSLQGQVNPNEQPVSPPQCTPAVTSNHNAGDKVANVTVTVKVSCSGEVYNKGAAQTIAADLLKQQATQTPGPGYALVGNLVTTVKHVLVTDPANGTLSLTVRAEGIWVFQFSIAQKQSLANLIAGKSKQDAQALLLKQMGVVKADIQFPWFSGYTLPTDPSAITMVVQSVPGVQGSTTSTTGPGSPPVPTNTPASSVRKG